MLKIRVSAGDVVQIGDLSIRAEHTHAHGLRIFAWGKDGIEREFSPPMIDLAPGTQIKVERAGRKVNLAIAAPKSVVIRKPCDTRYCSP